MSAEPVTNFDRVADIYDQTRGWPPDAAATIGAGLYSLLAPFAQGDRVRVVEVGAGTGRVLGPLTAHPVWAVGVDVSAGMLGRLREKVATGGGPGRAYPVLGDVRRLPLAAGQFDAGVFVHILHLVKPWEAVLAEVRRVVRPGGAFAFGLDEWQPGEADWIEERWDELVGYPKGEPPGHVSLAVTASDLLAAEGYTVTRHTLARWSRPTTPARYLQYRRERWYSASWAIPDAVLLPAADQLEAELLARYGDLDTPLSRSADFQVLLAHRES
jgi:SAM-dependent methyltransferase